VNHRIDGQTVLDWLIAIAVGVGVLLVLEIVKWVARRYQRRTDNDGTLRELPAKLIGSTQNYTLVIVAIFTASFALELTPTVQRAIHGGALAVMLLQAGLWANGVLLFAAQRMQARAAVEPEGGLAPGTIYAVRFLANLALWTLLLLVALDNVGVQITTLVAGLGIGGIAVALAAQSVLGDLFASLVIVLDRPFVVGDFIILGDFMGSVERIGIKTTRVRSLSGEQIIFPNHDLVSSRVRNYKRMLERRIVFSLGLVYGTTADRMQRAVQIVREAIEHQQPNTRFDRAHFNAFGDFSLNIEAVYYVLSPDYLVYMNVQQAINLELLQRFGDEGLDFAFPTQTVYVEGVAGSGAGATAGQAAGS
jgi:small-conductance mechanosensitive channel